MYHYILYWTIVFGAIHPSKQQGSLKAEFNTRRQVDSALSYLQNEAATKHFMLRTRVDSTKIK